MYCVIQKVINKKPDIHGVHNEIYVKQKSWSCKDGYYPYEYDYSEERIERPIFDAYKVSIHRSYRVDGKIKKDQWVIGTYGHYYLVDYSYFGDYFNANVMKSKLDEMGITAQQLIEIVEKKLRPLVAQIKWEHRKTEEYKTCKLHEKIRNSHYKAKKDFEKLYGEDSYDYCYDVFGVLRNEEYLKIIKQRQKERKEYEERSYRAYKDRTYSNSSYYDFGSNNYSSNGSSGYRVGFSNNYTESDKAKLKKIYKVASAKFHPDIAKDDGEMMKFLNKMKEDWGI